MSPCDPLNNSQPLNAGATEISAKYHHLTDELRVSALRTSSLDDRTVSGFIRLVEHSFSFEDSHNLALLSVNGNHGQKHITNTSE